MKEKNVKTCFDGIDSISNDLCDEMFVNELEKRLETDPLIPNGLLDLVSTHYCPLKIANSSLKLLNYSLLLEIFLRNDLKS